MGERHHRSHNEHEGDVCGDQAVPRPVAQFHLPVVEGHLPDEDQQDADRVDEHEAHERGEEHDGAYAAVDAERAHRGGREPNAAVEGEHDRREHAEDRDVLHPRLVEALVKLPFQLCAFLVRLIPFRFHFGDCRFECAHGLLLFDIVAQPRLFQVDVVGEFEDTFRLVTKSMRRQVLMDDANVLGEAVDRIGDPFVQVPRGLPECVKYQVADVGISMAIGLAPPPYSFAKKFEARRMSSWESAAASSVLARDSSMSRRALRFCASSLPAFIGGTFRGGFERVPILLVSRERTLPKFSAAFA